MDNILYLCGNCPFFKSDRCEILDESTKADDKCNCVGIYEFMTAERAEKILHLYQKWRRGYKCKMPNSYIIGVAIDEAIRVLRKEKKINES